MRELRDQYARTCVRVMGYYYIGLLTSSAVPPSQHSRSHTPPPWMGCKEQSWRFLPCPSRARQAHNRFKGAIGAKDRDGSDPHGRGAARRWSADRATTRK